jgi:trimeric autotransporter adhesin
MLKRTTFRICMLSWVFIFMGSSLPAQQLAPAAGAVKTNGARTLLASLRPNPELHWQRVSPSAEKPDGPVLYQLLFSTAGTTGTLAKFDSNPRHLTNSDITDLGGVVAIGGMSINAGSGIITFAGGQTFPGAGSSVSITASGGLTAAPNPITGTGTISIASGGVQAGNIAGGQVVKNLNGLFDGVTLAAGTGVSITPSGQTLTIANTSPASPAWGLSGNSGTGCTTSPCAKFLGTIDNTSLEMRVNNLRVFRIEPGTSSMTFGSFNVIGGYGGNAVTAGAGGATIAGGGANSNLNIVTDDFGTIGGGNLNQAGDNAGTTSDHAYATVAGGRGNSATGGWSSVGGGFNNTASGSDSAIGGGESNLASGVDATVNGGNSDRAISNSDTVGGGYHNTASGGDSTVAGGDNNSASGTGSTIGGGSLITASGGGSIVAGGYGNTASGDYATIGGGLGNTANGIRTTIAGGGRTNTSDATTGNRVTDDFGTIGGGGNNQAGDNAGTTSDKPYATVAGGFGNLASGDTSTIAGGSQNIASGQIAFVGGGFANKATAAASAVCGGVSSTASSVSATVAGGQGNTASGTYSTVAGGQGNTASGTGSTVAGGQTGTASGTNSFAVGESTTASADNSFALGRHANTNGFIGSFVWGDASSGTDVNATGSDQFVVRAVGGAIFYTLSDLSTGVRLFSGGGGWASLSDRNVKERFSPVDNRQLLDRVLALPITTWKYKSQAASIRHIGPMAQDFHSAFNVGEDDKHITEIDEGGVALAAIQGLNQKLEDDVQQLQAQLQNKDAQISALKADVEQLRQLSQGLVQRLAEVERTQRQQVKLRAAN